MNLSSLSVIAFILSVPSVFHFFLVLRFCRLVFTLPIMRSTILTLLLSGAGALGDASANYTQQLLSSGTVKLGDWQAAYDKAFALVQTLNTTEKISIITAGSGGNFSALAMLDSNTNVRPYFPVAIPCKNSGTRCFIESFLVPDLKILSQTPGIAFRSIAPFQNLTKDHTDTSQPLSYFYVTTWPAGSAMAMTWDTDAILGQGSALGAEFRGKGINLAYAPTMEPLGRSAWGGRLGETYGADSFLNGAMGGQFVKGMGSAGVIPSSKHYILNEVRMFSHRFPLDSIMDFDTLRHYRQKVNIY